MSIRNFIDTSLHSLHIKSDALASQSSYATNIFGFAWGALTFNQWVMVITLILGILTFVINFYFQYKRNKREKAKEARDKIEHRHHMNED